MALAHISHTGVIPGPPALFAGGSGIGSPRKHTDCRAMDPARHPE